ncbi:VWA domain-containing protein [Candidatus Sumerlaeota bacterium]|nr:VWA domain-containing protein [Candidatus Sumerlaeota bacterium]
MISQSDDSPLLDDVYAGFRRPSWISRNAKQRVVLVRDKSGSMYGKKAKCASAACRDLVAELAEPENKDGFYVSVIDFARTSEIIHDNEKATALCGKLKELSVSIFNTSTNISAGLEDAFSILMKAEADVQDNVRYLKPVVIVFTDGCHNKGPDPRVIAASLKDIADVVTVAFGHDADEELMRALASTSQHFYRCSKGSELRSFLAAVGATMTTTMAAGTNASNALAMIQQQ